MMKNLKIFLGVLLSLTLGFGLVACGSSGGSSNSTPSLDGQFSGGFFRNAVDATVSGFYNVTTSKATGSFSSVGTYSKD